MTAPSIREEYRELLRQLSRVYEPGEAASVARIIFEDAFGVWNLNRQDALTPAQRIRLLDMKARLLQHEPVQYILGLADFYGLKFRVDRRVLIPRQETEELVHWILEENGEMPLKVLDIGAGSGCIPVTLKKHRPGWQVEALDISQGALEVARENAEENRVEVRFFQSDILDKAQWVELEHYDIIISNPPYIPDVETGLMPERVLRYEPHQALFVGQGGPMLFYQAIAELAMKALSPGGSLFYEVNEFHANEVIQVVEKQGFEPVVLKQDLNGRNRMVNGIKPANNF